MSQLGGIEGDSNSWSGEGGGEEEFGFRWSVEVSGAGLKVVDISEGKRTGVNVAPSYHQRTDHVTTSYLLSAK